MDVWSFGLRAAFWRGTRVREQRPDGTLIQTDVDGEKTVHTWDKAGGTTLWRIETTRKDGSTSLHVIELTSPEGG